MRKLYILGLIALAAVIIGLAWAEQMTFSTYYPAPYGVYNQMATRTLGVGDNSGDGNITSADVPDPTSQDSLYVAGNVGIGTTSPEAPAPNAEPGNLDVNDVYLRSTEQWVSASAGGMWRHSGTQVWNTNAPGSWTDINLSPYVGSNHALVFLKVYVAGLCDMSFRTNGESITLGRPFTANAFGCGCSNGTTDNNYIYVTVETDANGIVEWKNYNGGGFNADVWLMGYVR